MPLKPCIECGTLTTNSRCPAHQRPAWQSSQRATAAQRGYDAAWRAFRKAHLQLEPNCRDCGAPATQVDHIKRLSLGGARLDHRNAASRCTPCHKRKTQHEAKQAANAARKHRQAQPGGVPKP